MIWRIAIESTSELLTFICSMRRERERHIIFRSLFTESTSRMFESFHTSERETTSKTVFDKKKKEKQQRTARINQALIMNSMIAK